MQTFAYPALPQQLLITETPFPKTYIVSDDEKLLLYQQQDRCTVSAKHLRKTILDRVKKTAENKGPGLSLRPETKSCDNIP